MKLFPNFTRRHLITHTNMLDYRSIAVLVKGDHMQISFKLAAKLQRIKFLRIEISYDCVVIEGYRTWTERSYGKLSFR